VFVRVVVFLSILALAAAYAARPSGSASREQVYVVKAYDTLWSIAAAQYSGDPREAIWRIQERNGLDRALIRPGQRLVLPR